MSTGVEYAKETQINPGRTGAGTAPPADIYNPNPHDPVTGFAPARTGAFTEGETTTVAAYGFDTIELSRQWQVSAGARVERYDTDFLSVAIPGSGTADIKLGVSDTLTSWNSGVVFKPVDNGSVYLSAATTQTPPGGLNFTLSPTTTNANNPALEPQKSTNYELGTKWDVARWAPVDDRGRVPHSQHQRRHDRDDRRHGCRCQLRQRAASRRHRAARSAG